MATTPPPNNNHAEVTGSAFGQKISISTREVIPLLILIVAGVAGYLVWLALDKRLDSMQAHHVRTIEMLFEQRANIDERMKDIHQLFAVHDYNCGRSLADRLPLDVPAPFLPPHLGELPPVPRQP